MTNKIGDIINSRIDKIEQSIHISSDIPEDLKEPLLFWLALAREDQEWKREQRMRIQKVEWTEEKKEFKSKRTATWINILFFLIIISGVCKIIYWILPAIQYIKSIYRIQTPSVSHYSHALERISASYQDFIFLLCGMIFCMFIAIPICFYFANRAANKRYGKNFSERNKKPD